MGDSLAKLRQQLDGVRELQSVVRTMKAMAGASLGQYEQAVRALADYFRAVELGLAVCLRTTAEAGAPLEAELPARARTERVGAIIFGSDQGLVGRFNDVVVQYAADTLSPRAEAHQVWVVGDRASVQLAELGLSPREAFGVPHSVEAISSLVSRVQLACEAWLAKTPRGSLYVFHNRPRPGGLYEPARQRLLPLDAEWQAALAKQAWPTRHLPEALDGASSTLGALVHEYLFISLFRACAESLASENASRLAAMQRAEQNMDELLFSLRGTFNRLRQGSIDEELFDVISGSAVAGRAG